MPHPAPWLVLTLLAAPAPPDEFAFFHENVMGTSLELRVRAGSADAARRAEARVLAEIDRLAAILSNHDARSEFRRWQAAPAAPASVSPELFDLLHDAESWRVRSAGAFDPRAELVARLWTACESAGRLPTDAERAEAASRLAGAPYRLDATARTAERLTDAPLTLDAIAKGAIVERAAAAGLGDGVEGLLLNVGGDLRAVGDATWTIGLAPARGDSETARPVAWLAVRDRSVATSGGSQRSFDIGGRRYSHILDPRSALPADRVAAATVVAPRGADADALATALNVLEPEDGLRLVAAVPGAACRITTLDGRIFASPTWEGVETIAASMDSRATAHPGADAPRPPDPQAAGGHPRSDDAWPDGFELAVEFTIARPEAEPGRYRRPYVVVWVEDERGELARQLVVWVSQTGAGPDQWLPDLTRWYGSQDVKGRTRRKNYLYTIGRPTRPAGRYTVVWDGKDDQGRPLPRGRYTLFLEAAREHGTHQLMRKRLEIADTPFTEQIPGNVEIESATVEYRRKAEAK